MRFLKNAGACAAISFCVSACDRHSDNFEKMMNLPEEQWVEFSLKLDVPERLNLYLELKENSGHPGNQELSFAFSGQSNETYKEIVSRVSKGDNNSNYLWVLKEIDRSDEFSVCDQSDRVYIQKYLEKTFKELSEMDKDFLKQLEFYDC